MNRRDNHPVVRTSRGVVRGRWDGQVGVFRGIPFAAPPVGERRFQAPQPADPWDGVREADVFGPPPPQGLGPPLPPTPASPAPSRHHPTEWLTLNVWTPDPGSAGLAVMVWIYGGGYRFGSSAEPGYDGAALARTGVVVVTANHRVGMEGYGDLAGAPPNRALLDQIATLRWVQQEIGVFGGNPARVTVFGESAGAGAIAALMVMPLAKGLFGQAIAHSVPGTYFSHDMARDISTELLQPLGLQPTVAALGAVPPERLLAAMAEFDRRMPPINRWGTFSPVVDGELLPTDPWTGLAAGTGHDIRLLVGHNRDEWRLFLVLDGMVGAVTNEMAQEAMELFGPGQDAARRLRRAYPAATAEELYVIARSDRMFRIPSLHLAAAHTAGGGRTHLCELTWPAPGAGGLFGACHGLDVPLVFGVLDQGLAVQLLDTPPDAAAAEISTQMQAAWTAFARTGEPGWVSYDERHRATRVFDSTAQGGVRAYPEEASRQLWLDTAIGVLDVRR
ncbi:MAG: carboxylesterase family protein [Nakamurella sp.]